MLSTRQQCRRRAQVYIYDSGVSTDGDALALRDQSVVNALPVTCTVCLGGHHTAGSAKQGQANSLAHLVRPSKLLRICVPHGAMIRVLLLTCSSMWCLSRGQGLLSRPDET